MTSSSDNIVQGIDTDRQDLLVRYACGDLTLAEAASLQAQLAADPALAREAESLQRAFESIGTAAAVEPPAHLRQKVLNAVAQSARSNDTSLTERAKSHKRWSTTVLGLLATAATVACVALLVDRAQLQRDAKLQTQAAAMLREPNVVLSFELQGSGSAADARGVVLLDLDARRASIALTKLPPLPAGQAYHLWAVLEDKQVPCGRFVRDASGAIYTQFAVPIESYTSPIQRLIVTVGPDTEQSSPRGAVLLSS